MIHTLKWGFAATLCALAPLPAVAQTAPACAAPRAAGPAPSPTVAALCGLAPVGALLGSPAGRAALAANLAVTEGIQTGTSRQPTLLAFPDQQRQALRDAFITDLNATQLADGLGTRLGDAYQAQTRYESFDSIPPTPKAVADLIGYANATTKADSGAGKYFFANATRDGKAPVPAETVAILGERGGVADVFGKAYDRPAGSPGADPYGNSRPFQTLSRLVAFRGADYFGRPSHSLDWLRGPNQTLGDSPSYPSGHTTYGYTEAMILAILVPERYAQMVVRAAEYGNDRIVLGAHYAMDVIGGRTLALHDLAHLLANDKAYVNGPKRNAALPNSMGQRPSDAIDVPDVQAAVKAARAEMTALLEARCGGPVALCAATDGGRFADPVADKAFYDSTQTYGLPTVHPETAGGPEDVATIAPEAGYLLTAAFPALSLREADDILTATEGPGGGFLDDGSAFGLYSRLDLYAAAGRAAALAASRR